MVVLRAKGARTVMTVSRRSFLGFLGLGVSALAAPAIVRFQALMPVKTLPPAEILDTALAHGLSPGDVVNFSWDGSGWTPEGRTSRYARAQRGRRGEYVVMVNGDEASLCAETDLRLPQGVEIGRVVSVMNRMPQSITIRA